MAANFRKGCWCRESAALCCGLPGEFHLNLGPDFNSNRHGAPFQGNRFLPAVRIPYLIEWTSGSRVTQFFRVSTLKQSSASIEHSGKQQPRLRRIRGSSEPACGLVRLPKKSCRQLQLDLPLCPELNAGPLSNRQSPPTAHDGALAASPVGVFRVIVGGAGFCLHRR
jgi:hypothetical protein